jgi:hypothetical protein
MNFSDLLQDPHFNKIIYRIERLILECDEATKSFDVSLTDSNIKSCLRKVIAFSEGKSPGLAEKNDKEKAIRDLVGGLSYLGDRMQEGSDTVERFSKKDWILALKAVEDSLKTRRKMYGHSRGYLEFLKEFLEKGEII